MDETMMVIRCMHTALSIHARQLGDKTALSHGPVFAVDSLSRSCSGVNLSRSHQRKPSGQGTPSRCGSSLAGQPAGSIGTRTTTTTGGGNTLSLVGAHVLRTDADGDLDGLVL